MLHFPLLVARPTRSHHRLMPILFAALVLVTTLPATAFSDEKLLTGSSCLSSLDEIILKCSKPKEKIAVRSASYGHADNCSNSGVDNDCVQQSVLLVTEAQAKCNGFTQCTILVKSIDTFNSEQQMTLGIDAEKINHNVDTCTLNGNFKENVAMNLYQVKYECKVSQAIMAAAEQTLNSSDHRVGKTTAGEGLDVCDKVSDEVVELVVETYKYPDKSVTDPTCKCRYSLADPESSLIGYAQCKERIKLIAEETYRDNTTGHVEYECKDKTGSDVLRIGEKMPHTINLKIDAKNSDEESSYKINWVVIQNSIRSPQTPVKIDCVGGRRYVKRSVRAIAAGVSTGVVLLVIVAVGYIFRHRIRAIITSSRKEHIQKE